MYGTELNDLYLRKDFIGTFALNELPVFEKRPISFIFNTDYSNGLGEHWLAMVLPQNNEKIIYIDPLCLRMNSTVKEIRQFLFTRGKYIECIPFAIQSIFSDSCGLYCAYILSKLSFYRDNLNTLIMNEFVEFNYQYNEQKVLQWWYKEQQK